MYGLHVKNSYHAKKRQKISQCDPYQSGSKLILIRCSQKDKTCLSTSRGNKVTGCQIEKSLKNPFSFEVYNSLVAQNFTFSSFFA